MRLRRTAITLAIALTTSFCATAVATAAPAAPCRSGVAACVDLRSQQAWLLKDGLNYGPVPIKAGAARTPTLVGNFKVQWKDKYHRSSEFHNAPMYYAVFFEPGGIAFHEGSLKIPSAGCVHLSHNDAVKFYDTLQVGDPVEVVD